jgi:hypothetical protein
MLCMLRGLNLLDSSFSFTRYIYVFYIVLRNV